jgi:hypothetical protein
MSGIALGGGCLGLFESGAVGWVWLTLVQV